MRSILTVGATACAIIFQPHSYAQQPELQQKLGIVREGIAQNQSALKQYTWTDQTNVLLNGELKTTTYYRCQYSPDGTVARIETSGSAPPGQPRGRIRQRVVEKKKDELKSYMQQAGALIKEYVPPDPEQMKANFIAGNASFGQAAPGTLQLHFRNYVKPDDSLAVTFVPAAKALTQINVNTYMNDRKDAVTLQVNFENLPGGPNHVAQTVLNAPAKGIQVQTTSSNFQRMGQ